MTVAVLVAVFGAAAALFGYELRWLIDAARRRSALAEVRRAAPELFDQDDDFAGWEQEWQP